MGDLQPHSLQLPDGRTLQWQSLTREYIKYLDSDRLVFTPPTLTAS